MDTADSIPLDPVHSSVNTNGGGSEEEDKAGNRTPPPSARRETTITVISPVVKDPPLSAKALPSPHTSVDAASATPSSTAVRTETVIRTPQQRTPAVSSKASTPQLLPISEARVPKFPSLADFQPSSAPAGVRGVARCSSEQPLVAAKKRKSASASVSGVDVTPTKRRSPRIAAALDTVAAQEHEEGGNEESLNESHIIAVSEESVAELFDILPGAGSDVKEPNTPANDEKEEQAGADGTKGSLATLAYISVAPPVNTIPATTGSSSTSNGPTGNHAEAATPKQQTPAAKITSSATPLNTAIPTAAATTPLSSKAAFNPRQSAIAVIAGMHSLIHFSQSSQQ